MIFIKYISKILYILLGGSDLQVIFIFRKMKTGPFYSHSSGKLYPIHRCDNFLPTPSFGKKFCQKCSTPTLQHSNTLTIHHYNTLTIHHYNTTTLKIHKFRKSVTTNQPINNIDTRDPTGSKNLKINLSIAQEKTSLRMYKKHREAKTSKVRLSQIKQL